MNASVHLVWRIQGTRRPVASKPYIDLLKKSQYNLLLFDKSDFRRESLCAFCLAHRLVSGTIIPLDSKLKTPQGSIVNLEEITIESYVLVTVKIMPITVWYFQ